MEHPKAHAIILSEKIIIPLHRNPTLLDCKSRPLQNLIFRASNVPGGLVVKVPALVSKVRVRPAKTEPCALYEYWMNGPPLDPGTTIMTAVIDKLNLDHQILPCVPIVQLRPPSLEEKYTY